MSNPILQGYGGGGSIVLEGFGLSVMRPPRTPNSTEEVVDSTLEIGVIWPVITTPCTDDGTNSMYPWSI